MESNITKYQNDLESLIERGQCLYYGLINEFSNEYKGQIAKLPKGKQVEIKKCSFKNDYNSWYNESLSLIKQLMPERLEDFVSYYKQPKRKSLTYETYSISDYLVSLMAYDGWGGELFKSSTIINKYEQQFKILKSLKNRFNSTLYDIRQLLQADVFDSETDAAKELCKKGFYRAAGAICSVVLEKHLKSVCEKRNIKTRKNTPTINDYNQLLKDSDVIDIVMWRFIQRLGDIRNLCDHDKDVEPTQVIVAELIDGTDRVIKTVF